MQNLDFVEVIGGTVSLRGLTHWIAVGLLMAGCAATKSPVAWGQEPAPEQIARKLKSKVAPVYPELARRMNIVGVVKVQITVDKAGAIKNTKLVGGHPILAGAAMDAVKKWRYESGSEETIGVVEFHFDPVQQ
jgi:TonB family protein